MHLSHRRLTRIVRSSAHVQGVSLLSLYKNFLKSVTNNRIAVLFCFSKMRFETLLFLALACCTVCWVKADNPIDDYARVTISCLYIILFFPIYDIF